MQNLKEILVGIQMLFVAFGALVLVPLLTGISPAVALLSAGIGTLCFQLFTGRQVPIFLGSSFAFIAPLIYASAIGGWRRRRAASSPFRSSISSSPFSSACSVPALSTAFSRR